MLTGACKSVSGPLVWKKCSRHDEIRLEKKDEEIKGSCDGQRRDERE